MSDSFVPSLENIEPTRMQEVQVERRALDDATNEPQAYVEQTGDYQQAEAIQAAFETVVENAATVNAPREAATPSRPEQAASEPTPDQQVMRANIELPEPVDTQEEHIETTVQPASEEDPLDEPVQLMEAQGPELQPEVVPQAKDGSQVGTIPGPLPYPIGENNSQIPSEIKLPQPWETQEEFIEAPSEATPVESIPIQLPGEANAALTPENDLRINPAEAQVQGPETVADLPLPIPKPAAEVSPQVEQAQRGGLPGPLPYPTGENNSQIPSGVKLPQPWETQEEFIEPAAEATPVEAIPIQLPGEADAALTPENDQRLDKADAQVQGPEAAGTLPTPLPHPAAETSPQINQAQRGSLPIPIPHPTDEAYSKKIKMPKVRTTPEENVQVPAEPLSDQQSLRADAELPQPWETQEKFIETAEQSGYSEVPPEDEEEQLINQAAEALQPDIQPGLAPQVRAGDQVANLPGPLPYPAMDANLPEDNAAELRSQRRVVPPGASEIGDVRAPLSQPETEGFAGGTEAKTFQDVVEGMGKSLGDVGPAGMAEGFAPPGFDAVENYLKGLPKSGGTKGSTGYSGGLSGAPESSGTGTQTGWQDQGESMSKPQEDFGHESSGQTVDDIFNEFTDYCKDAYDSGDRPADGDISGWVGEKAADFFEDKGIDSPLIDILREVAKDKTGDENPDSGITVTRIEADSDLDDGGDDDGGDDDEGDDDEGDDDGGDNDGDDDDGDDGEDDDGDDDDGDDGEDDDGDDDDGDDDDDDGDDDGGGEESGGNDTGMDVEGDDTGRRSPILEGGSSSGLDEKDDTGRREIILGASGAGGDSGGSDGGDGDDTGGKESVYLQGGGKIYPDSGGARPIDPIPASELDSGMMTSSSEGSVQNQLEVITKDNNFSIHLGAGGLVSWKRTSTK